VWRAGEGVVADMKQEEKDLNDTLFDEIICTYNSSRHLMHKKMKHVLKYVQKGETLIDVGCGIGEFIVQLKDHFHTLVGVDINPREIEFAKKRLGRQDNVSLYCGELESLRFPDEHFDVCLCLDVLEHVPTVFQLLQETYRVLRTDGDLIVTVPNWYDIIVSKTLKRNPQHVNTFTPWHWMGILRKVGFKIRFYRAVDFPLIKSDFLSREIPILGMCILIVAHK
jgi:ubiquinone/menaquinone biosynthesis C-methylase UbiE